MPAPNGFAIPRLKVIYFLLLLLSPLKVLSGVQAVPTLSHDGNVTLEWGPSTCDSNTRVTTTITRQVGTQTVAVASLPDGQYEYKLTSLANGSYQYNVSHCYYTSSSGFCAPSTPLSFTVNRSVPPAAAPDFAARINSSDANAVDLSWRYSLYKPFVDRRSTAVYFSRNGESKRYLAYDNGSCGTNHKVTVPDLVSGHYRFYLEICGRTTKTSTATTCSTTKTVDISVAGTDLDVGDSPQPVPSHQNVIQLQFQSSDSSTTLTATTAGALSVDNGTANYTIPLKLPPAAAALMPGLALQYNSNKGNVNDDITPAGFGWSVTGFSTIAGCESGHLKPCKKKLDDKETFVRRTVLYNKWFQPESVTHLADASGTRYWYGENGFGQGATGKQISKIEDVYGNRASVHYRPDGRVGFIYFSSRDTVIFEYTNGYVKAVTTFIESSLDSPASGQVVSRYEITHEKSTVTDNQLVRSIRECGFDDDGNKACAKPLTFDWSKGQLGFQSTPFSTDCPAGTRSLGLMTGDLDEDGYSDGYLYGYSISWGEKKQGCGNSQTAPSDLSSTDNMGREAKAMVLRTKDGKFLFNNMKLYRPSKTQGTTLVLTLFDTKTFLTPGRVGYEYPSVSTIVDDFNADGLDDVYYGGAYWFQNPTSPPTFSWDGKAPKYDRDASSVPNMTYEVSEYTGERKVAVGYIKPRDVNGDGKLDRLNEVPGFGIGIDSFDYNKDGRTDAFYIKDGDFVFDLNIKSGNDFVRAGKPFSAFNGIAAAWAKETNASMEISNGKFNLFPGDWTGDGVPDVFLAKANGPYAGLRGKPDLLEKVTDGFGARLTIEYDTLHGDLVDGKTFYTPASISPKWPYEHVGRGMNVVKKVGQSNGVGGFTYEQYYYQGGIYNVAKREFMAFEKVTRILPDHGLVQNTYYDYKTPFNGTIVKTESKTAAGQWISRVTNHYVTHPENTRFVYNDYSISEDFKLQSKPISVTKITNAFDRYGALLTSESLVGSALSGTNVTGVLQRSFIENIPEHDADQWLLGFINRTTSTTERGDGSDRRVHTHEYIREPGTVDVQQSTKYVGTDVELTTTYIRDQRSGANPGVVTETRVSARDPVAPASAERSISLAGFENGIYPTVSYNAVGHESFFGYDKRIGKANYSRDPNGLESTTVFDPLGRSIQIVASTGVITALESYFCSQSPYSCPEHAAYVSLTRSIHPNAGNNLAEPLTVEFYDSLQRVVRVQTQSMNGTWVKQDTHYDELGRLEQVSEPFTSTPQAFTSYTNYSALGEALLIVHPDGSSAELSHTLSNSLYVSTLTNKLVGSQSNNHTQVHTTRTNAAGQTHEVTDSGGVSTRYFYNSRGYLEGTRVNNNDATRVSVEYDVAGNKTGMNDPAAGRIDFVYNGFGELRKQIWQINTSNEKAMRFDYDLLGRQVKRVDIASNGATSTNVWRYDVEKPGTLYSETDANSWTKIYSYDSFTRPNKLTENFGDGAKVTSFTYDNFSRPDTVTYPNSTAIKSVYSSQGIHYQTMDTTSGRNKVLWQLYDTIDGRGEYRYTKLGNNVVTRRTFDPVTGRLQAITSGKVTSGVTSVTGTLQQLGYEWDSVGNLQHRTSQRVNSSGSQIENITEQFNYDNLNRLQYAVTSGASITPRTRDYEYDTYGNMIHNGVSSQQYAQVNGASLYGVTRANNKDYHYDVYGNVIRRGTDTLSYNVFNKPTAIGSTKFWYGADQKKVKQQTGARTTYFYADGAYEVENNNGTITTTLRVGSYVQKKTGTTTTEEYHLFDHLDSADVITDANGALRSRMAFDALGNRLQDGFASVDSTSAGSDSYKGYTGHDMLDHLGLVHMGGRVYDPDSGRFLSADLFVQAPGNSQSYNRYSYVLNNPLSLVDPSGYLWTRYEAKSSPVEVEPALGYRDPPVQLGLSMADRMWLTSYLGTTSVNGVPYHVWGESVSRGPGQSALGQQINSAFRAMVAAQRQAYKILIRDGIRAAMNGIGLTLRGSPQGMIIAAGILPADTADNDDIAPYLADGRVNALAVASGHMPDPGDEDPDDEKNFTRDLRESDLGVKGTLEELRGSLSLRNGIVTARVDMIRGEIRNPLQVVSNLSATARSYGATTLRIEGTIANEKLYTVLVRRYGMISEGAKDVITISFR